MTDPRHLLDGLWARIDQGVATEQEKINAATLSSKSNNKAYVPRLLKLLDEPEGQVRYYALQSLVLGLNKKDEEMRRICMELLRQDPDEDVRGIAAACAGNISFGSRSSQIFSQLLAELKSPDQPARAKGSIHVALFQVVGRPPLEWPGLLGRAKVFEDSDIDWGRIAWLEDQLDR